MIACIGLVALCASLTASKPQAYAAAEWSGGFGAAQDGGAVVLLGKKRNA